MGLAPSSNVVPAEIPSSFLPPFLEKHPLPASPAERTSTSDSIAPTRGSALETSASSSTKYEKYRRFLVIIYENTKNGFYFTMQAHTLTPNLPTTRRNRHPQRQPPVMATASGSDEAVSELERERRVARLKCAPCRSRVTRDTSSRTKSNTKNKWACFLIAHTDVRAALSRAPAAYQPCMRGYLCSMPVSM